MCMYVVNNYLIVRGFFSSQDIVVTAAQTVTTSIATGSCHDISFESATTFDSAAYSAICAL